MEECKPILNTGLRGSTVATTKISDVDGQTNFDFYSASLYHYTVIPTDLFTPLFAISRIVGWAEEQSGRAAPKPVLYRPDSKYIGDYCGKDVCPFIPIDKR